MILTGTNAEAVRIAARIAGSATGSVRESAKWEAK